MGLLLRGRKLKLVPEIRMKKSIDSGEKVTKAEAEDTAYDADTIKIHHGDR